MKPLRIPTLIALLLFLSVSIRAEVLSPREWKVDGVTREALVHVPSEAKNKAAPLPVVFAFHGHGGSMQNAARMFSIHTRWTNAIVVYMQGLNTPGRLSDPEGKKPGWQKEIGDQEDRDLKFFDTVLTSLKKDYAVDEKRLFATGHSNGGSFSYVLWAARGEKFAAFAPSAAAAGKSLALLKPKPLMHLAAENDPLVKFEWQSTTITGVKKLNQCQSGKPWKDEPGCTLYESKQGAPVITFIHQNQHGFPPRGADLIVKFFQSIP